MSIQNTEKRRPQWKTVATVITLVAVGLLVYSSVTGGRHSVDPDQVQKNPESFIGKPIKIEGKVLKGSWLIDKKDSFKSTFKISGKDGATFAVKYYGAMPDPFAEERQVIITGILATKSEITAKRILVKCPSRYEDQKYDQHKMTKYKKKLRQNKLAGNR